jgi:hypothetical protein
MISKNIGRLAKNNTIFFQCDIQQVFKDKIHNFESVVQVAKLAAKLAPIFNVPLLVTEHNTKAFGKTVDEIQSCYPEKYTLYEKLLFSMLTDDVKGFLKTQPDRKNIVLYGIETHVCIQQTALDLLENGYNVHLLVDGVSSCRHADRTFALKRLEQSGVFLTSFESMTFELLHHAKSPEFKTVLGILKTERVGQLSNL